MREPGEDTTIRLPKSLRDRLRQCGRMGQSYADVIRDLIEKVESIERVRGR